MGFNVDVEGTWLNPSSVSLDAGELRRADAAIFAGDGSALGVAGGVVRHGDDSLLVTINGSDQVTIKAGAVVIPGNAAAGTGPYRFGLPTDQNPAGTLTARHATNSRIDLVVARQLDTDVVAGHGAYKGRFTMIDGTPAGSPSAPALPTMAVELARINVPPLGGGTATVDLSHRTFASAIGAEMFVTSATMLPSSAATYQSARALDTGLRYIFDGTTWRTGGPFAVAAGTTTISATGLAGTTAIGTSITFPAGRFTVPPIVTWSIEGIVAGAGLMIPRRTEAITTSGATLSLLNVGSTAATFTAMPLGWTAIQMTSNSAAG